MCSLPPLRLLLLMDYFVQFAMSALMYRFTLTSRTQANVLQTSGELSQYQIQANNNVCETICLNQPHSGDLVAESPQKVCAREESWSQRISSSGSLGSFY